ncbi:MAG: lysine N(6)-hydroxylase/L-ornithine N(5)-oxygenase family protein [Actinobacteria bacterium]|nr:lysine N(6)-hydroxylase/L-ornithine N(5)-oxygenase family protein [Actinomycetota bacterium]MBW3650622.1 lysine N(6)-hydroxylase/L-ornithine N(5)-oxygenase family protein [Actinomycetota bacterium]
MSQILPVDDAHVHDVIGIGFGPSNLALAIALKEHNERAGNDEAVSGLFLERQATFGWHRGMLIDDATMQVCFLKDLVTLRNPASGFGFLAYLHSKNRLLDFINCKSLYPLRIEFHDYLEWAAAKVDELVRYGHEVAAVRPVVQDGAVVAFDVVTATGSGGVTVHRARNLVFGLGLEPIVPSGASLGARTFHSRDLLGRVDRISDTSPARFVVVGAGQSAAEATAYLHRRFPGAEVCAVFSRYGYSPADDSSFANRIFDPTAVDEFYTAPSTVKRAIIDYHRNTNYSVVDHDLIQDLYARTYQEAVLGAKRLRVFNVCRLTDVVEDDDRLRVTIESMTTGDKTQLDADVVVYATGYRPADPTRLLGDLARYCRYDNDGQLRVERDYRVRTVRELQCGIYLQGGTEHTHGISSSLLSNTAVRAGEILESVVARRGRVISVEVPCPARGATVGRETADLGTTC